tara:strand:- start:59 stop:385 length:327 start_codon:yes stop_codon:yes gene_type:complete
MQNKSLLEALIRDTQNSYDMLEQDIEAIEVYITFHDMFDYDKKTSHVIIDLDSLKNYTLSQLNSDNIDVEGCIWIKNSNNWIDLDVSEYDGQYFYKWILRSKPKRFYI